MFVRILQQQEIMTAIHLMGDTFMVDIAPKCGQEGVDSFQRSIEYSTIMQRWNVGELACFGVFEGMQLLGAGVLERGRHILHLFVQKAYQGRGIEQMLFQDMCRFYVHQYGAGVITVDAPTNMVACYQACGMRVTGSEQIREGIPSVSMEMVMDATMMNPPQMHKNQTGLIVGIVVGCLVLAIALAGFGLYVRQKTVQEFGNGYGQEEIYPYEDETDQEDFGAPSGLDQITPYIEEGLTYKIEEKPYEYEDTETKATDIYFEVVYPEIQGLDEDIQKKVNETLKKVALETVDEIYLNPSEEVKERVLEAEYPMLNCYTTYKVTHQGADVLSVIFEEMSYEGNSDAYVNQIRTVNLNLKDGTIYEIKDIVNLDEAFLTNWVEVMRDETELDDFLSELNQEQMKKALSGDSLEGVYFDCFFVHAGGIEIGYSFQYPSGDENDKGYIWVTAPFSVEELKEYKTGSDFWKEIF